MKKSIDASFDDHPSVADDPGAAWAVAVRDDCDECEDIRVELTLEPRDATGTGTIAHLSTPTARRLRAALAAALREVGEDPGP